MRSAQSLSSTSFIDDLRRTLLPTDAPVESVPDHRLAAILVLLYPDAGRTFCVLIRRPEGQGVHSGQIALPGGAWEPGDDSLVETALRETQEEIGVSPGVVQVLGRMAPITVRASGYHVVPIVGVTEQKPSFLPNPAEVDAIIELPLDVLLDDASVASEHWELRGRLWRVWLYAHGEHKVWGATARILSQLSRILGANMSVHDRPGHVEPLPPDE